MFTNMGCPDSPILWINDDDVIIHHCEVAKTLDDVLDHVVQYDFNRRHAEANQDPEPTIVAIKAADPAKKKRWQDSRTKALAASKKTRWNDNKDIRSYFVSTKK